MNILSINCCGLGADVKVNGIRDLIKKEKLHVIGIQETKMEVIDDGFVKLLWDNDYDYCYQGSIGFSGGTLLIWDSHTFVKTEVFNSHRCKR